MASNDEVEGKGGRVWNATRTAGNCGLTGTPIRQGDDCLFLTCSGSDARPEYQIRTTGEEVTTDRWGRRHKRLVRETPEGKQFRSVPTGQHRCCRNACGEIYDYAQKFCTAPHPEKDGRCRAKTKPIFKWQEQDSEGRWHDVTVWEKVVLADAAVRLGYHVPRRSNGAFVKTKANEGERTEGHAHSVSKLAEPVLMDLARAALSPEEMGEAPPIEGTEEPEHPGVARFLKLDLEPEPVPVPPKDVLTAEDIADPSVMRFRNLILD